MIDLLKRAAKLLDGGMIRYTSQDVETERKAVKSELDNLIQTSEAELARFEAGMDRLAEEEEKKRVVRLPVIP
jgi:hypothetical protein